MPEMIAILKERFNLHSSTVEHDYKLKDCFQKLRIGSIKINAK